MYTFFYFLLYTINVQIKRGIKIMETKKILNLLNNQYFKSLKHFENVYSFMSDFNKQLKGFNSGYLKLISAVLSGDTNDIRVSLYSSLLYIHATLDEKEKLDLELLDIF